MSRGGDADGPDAGLILQSYAAEAGQGGDSLNCLRDSLADQFPAAPMQGWSPSRLWACVARGDGRRRFESLAAADWRWVGLASCALNFHDGAFPPSLAFTAWRLNLWHSARTWRSGILLSPGGDQLFAGGMIGAMPAGHAPAGSRGLWPPDRRHISAAVGEPIAMFDACQSHS